MLLSSLMPSLNDNEVTEQWQKLSSLYWGSLKSMFRKTKQDSKKIFSADFLQNAEPFHWTFNDLYYLTLPQPAGG